MDCLERFSHLIKQHDRHSFRIFPHTKGAEGSHCHQEILIKHLAVADIPECLIYNVPSYKNIGNQIQGHLSPQPKPLR